MIAVIAIYATALILCLWAGVVLGAALDLGGRWLTVRTLPMGAATTMALLYALGYFLPVRLAAPILVGILIAGLAVVVVLRLRLNGERTPEATRGATIWTSARAAFTPRLPDTIVVCLGVLGGLVLLTPLLRLGYPTTIAYSNNDGWAYVSIIEWLHGHSIGPRVLPDMEKPITLAPWAQLGAGFGVGFELISSTTMTLLGRRAFEMVNAVSAIGIPIAACGWACIWQAVTGRLERMHAALVVLAVLSPVFLLPFTENYTTQFVAICFWPFAMGSFVYYARRPSVRRVIPAALGTAAVLGAYPPLAPWLVPPLLLAGLIGGRWPTTIAGWRDARAYLPRLRHAALILAGFAVTLVIVAPIQVRHTLRWFTGHSASAGVSFPRLGYDDYLVWATGTTAPYSYITGAPIAWSVTAAALIVVPIFVIGLLLPLRRGEAPKRSMLLLTAGSLVTTAAVFTAFRITDPLGYGLYKAIMTGAAMLAGLVILSLIPRRPSARSTPRFMAIAVLAAVWVPVSGQLLEQTYNGYPGFRRADIELGRALDALPPGNDVLIEGAAEETGSFQVRMMQSYFGSALADQDMEGLGSSASYISPGGQPQWRPSDPWTYVVTIHPTGSPFGRGRVQVWSNGVYWLWRAPSLDVTPFGATWYPPEKDGKRYFQWTSGNVQLILSNRSDRPRDVSLRMRAASYAVPRRVTFARDGEKGRTVTIPATGVVPISLPFRLPAHSTTAINLTSDRKPSAAPKPDPRTLSLRLQDISLVPR